VARAALLSLALLTLCALLAEGAIDDRSAVYLRDSLGASVGGGRWLRRVIADGGRRSASAGATSPSGLALRGSSGACPARGHAVVGAIGFGLVGLGLANAIPVVFSAAGRVSGVPAESVLAAVATPGYRAYLAGPPFIAFTAGVAGLRISLAIVVTCCAVIAIRPHSLPPSRFAQPVRHQARRRLVCWAVSIP